MVPTAIARGGKAADARPSSRAAGQPTAGGAGSCRAAGGWPRPASWQPSAHVPPARLAVGSLGPPQNHTCACAYVHMHPPCVLGGAPMAALPAAQRARKLCAHAATVFQRVRGARRGQSRGEAARGGGGAAGHRPAVGERCAAGAPAQHPAESQQTLLHLARAGSAGCGAARERVPAGCHPAGGGVRGPPERAALGAGAKGGGWRPRDMKCKPECAWRTGGAPGCGARACVCGGQVGRQAAVGPMHRSGARPGASGCAGTPAAAAGRGAARC